MAKDENQGQRALRPETQLVHGGTLRSQFGETSEAMFLTQGFVYDSAEQAAARFTGESPGYQYSRFGNPTVSMFEERVRLLEGAEDARATATGMAAISAALLSCLRAGDHIVAARAMFGSCRYIVETQAPRFGIASTLVDGRDLAQWKAAIRPNTKVLFFETPANPTLELVDIAAVSKLAHDAGALCIVDNVFATPMLQRPLEHGADVVAYSATKHIDGQGRCLGGVVLGSAKYVKDHLHDYIRQTGPSLSPFNAWVMLKGLETMPLRVKAACENAAQRRRLAGGAQGRHPGALSRPRRPSAGGDRGKADDRRWPGGGVRSRRRQGGDVPFPQCAEDRQDFQQPRRREKPRHPSGDDHPPAVDAGGAGRTWHRRYAGAAVGRHRAYRRPDRGSRWSAAAGGVAVLR